MKINELPIAIAEQEICSRSTSEKYIKLAEQIKELDGSSAIVIVCEDKKEMDRTVVFLYGYNSRNGRNLKINQTSAQKKIYVRKLKSIKSNKGNR